MIASSLYGKKEKIGSNHFALLGWLLLTDRNIQENVREEVFLLAWQYSQEKTYN